MAISDDILGVFIIGASVIVISLLGVMHFMNNQKQDSQFSQQSYLVDHEASADVDPVQHMGESEDAGEGIVDLVRHAGGQSADGGQPFRPRQLLSRPFLEQLITLPE